MIPSKWPKNLGTSKWESPKFLILPINEYYNFMVYNVFIKIIFEEISRAKL